MNFRRLTSRERQLPIDTELNIVSLIDCFTVIIMYLLTAASFVSLGAIETQLAGAGGSGAATASTSLVAEIKADQSVEVSVLGGSVAAVRCPARAKGIDFEAVKAAVTQLKGSQNAVERLVLVAENQVSYAQLVATAYALGNQLPVVLAAGDAL